MYAPTFPKQYCTSQMHCFWEQRCSCLPPRCVAYVHVTAITGNCHMPVAFARSLPFGLLFVQFLVCRVVLCLVCCLKCFVVCLCFLPLLTALLSALSFALPFAMPFGLCPPLDIALMRPNGTPRLLLPPLATMLIVPLTGRWTDI